MKTLGKPENRGLEDQRPGDLDNRGEIDCTVNIAFKNGATLLGIPAYWSKASLLVNAYSGFVQSGTLPPNAYWHMQKTVIAVDFKDVSGIWV